MKIRMYIEAREFNGCMDVAQEIAGSDIDLSKTKKELSHDFEMKAKGGFVKCGIDRSGNFYYDIELVPDFVLKMLDKARPFFKAVYGVAKALIGFVEDINEDIEEYFDDVETTIDGIDEDEYYRIEAEKKEAEEAKEAGMTIEEYREHKQREEYKELYGHYPDEEPAAPHAEDLTE